MFLAPTSPVLEIDWGGGPRGNYDRTKVRLIRVEVEIEIEMMIVASRGRYYNYTCFRSLY